MSVLLDTNVVSELIRKSPDPAVEVWASGHILEDLFSSVVGEAKLRDAFESRILPFDSEGTGTTVKKARLGSFPVPIPPIDLQCRYAKLVANVHSITYPVGTSAARTAGLNASLMSHLLGADA